MWELLAVFGIYLAVSSVGMAALWTVAVRKGAVRAPSYFFWMRTVENPAIPTLSEASPSNEIWNAKPLGLAAATAVLLCAVSAPQLQGWAGASSNQRAWTNALIGS
jgi:hypothetical protein